MPVGRCQPLPPRAFQQVVFGAAQLRGQDGGGHGVVLQALDAAVQPVEPGPEVRGVRAIRGIRAARKPLAQRARAQTIELSQDLGGERGRTVARMVVDGQAQQLLIGAQVIGQKGAADLVAG